MYLFSHPPKMEIIVHKDNSISTSPRRRIIINHSFGLNFFFHLFYRNLSRLIPCISSSILPANVVVVTCFLIFFRRRKKEKILLQNIIFDMNQPTAVTIICCTSIIMIVELFSQFLRQRAFPTCR